MRMDEILDRTEMIKAAAPDYERQHSLEDKLHLDFIHYIATLPSPIAQKARAVLEVADMDFDRYCA